MYYRNNYIHVCAGFLHELYGLSYNIEGVQFGQGDITAYYQGALPAAYIGKAIVPSCDLIKMAGFYLNNFKIITIIDRMTFSSILIWDVWKPQNEFCASRLGFFTHPLQECNWIPRDQIK